MLSYLNIKNFALIDELSVEFDKGLNVITGETGAGKSMIIEAINVILGASIKQSWIKDENEILEVEALFYLDSISQKQWKLLQGFNTINLEDNQIIIRREIHQAKRSKCFVNNQLVTLSLIQNIGNYLIDLHGQHEHQSLLNSRSHIDFVDNFGDEKFLEKKEQHYTYFQNWQAKAKLLNDKKQKYTDTLSKKEYLLFQLKEINQAQLKEEEDKKLEGTLNVIKHNAKIKEIMENAYSVLFESAGTAEGAPVYDLLTRIISDFRNISHIERNIDNIRETLMDVQLKIEDISSQIMKYSDNIDLDIHQLQELEERLNLINHLKYKYGANIKDILSYHDNLQGQLDDIESDQMEIERLKKEIVELEKILIQLALELSEQRKSIAKKLEHNIISELVELNMKDCNFVIQIEQNESQNGLTIEEKKIDITQDGIDKIEFYISTNSGERIKPLTEIVSGGEVSRIMLGLKSILSKTEQIPTMIFDEIDSGVGARLGEIVALKLAKIAQDNQVITVTHLPQIAAQANQHLYINKCASNNKTTITLKRLSENERLYEIARMIDGEKYGSISIEHARKMLNKNGV